MSDAAVVSALTQKRAEIDGELLRAEQRIAALRSDQATIDAAILVFDPSRKPIRVEKPRQHGMSRVILGILRDATAPMTVREIAERVEPDNGQDHDALVHNIRNTVARRAGKDLVRGDRGGAVVWSVRRD
jgi:hypothetical protein